MYFVFTLAAPVYNAQVFPSFFSTYNGYSRHVIFLHSFNFCSHYQLLTSPVGLLVKSSKCKNLIVQPVIFQYSLLLLGRVLHLSYFVICYPLYKMAYFGSDNYSSSSQDERVILYRDRKHAILCKKTSGEP